MESTEDIGLPRSGVVGLYRIPNMSVGAELGPHTNSSLNHRAISPLSPVSLLILPPLTAQLTTQMYMHSVVSSRCTQFFRADSFVLLLSCALDFTSSLEIDGDYFK